MKPIYVLIPDYQPDDRMVQLVKALSYPVVVVDDGSGEAYDRLFEEAEAAGAAVLRYRPNKGKGEAIKTGLRHIAAEGKAEGVITADADGQHTPEDIEKVAAAMREHPDAFVIGGRDFSQMPPRSRAGNTITRFFFRVVTGLHISDTQTGLRGMPESLFQKLLETEGSRYEYEINVLIALKKWGTEYLEIPIKTIYIGKNESSHFHPLRDGLRVFSRVIRYALSSLGCTLVDYVLYTVLNLLHVPVSISYIAAKGASSILNYVCNSKLVFKRGITAKSVVLFALLVLFGMGVGSVSVKALTGWGLGKILSKLIVDVVLFFFNYFMQKYVVFPKKKSKAKN